VTKGSIEHRFAMTKLPGHKFGITAGICLILTLGCRKEAAPPSPVQIEQAPPMIEKVFEKAPTELLQDAGEVATALRNSDDAGALFELQSLSAKATLTAEQRNAVTRSMMAVHERLRTAAAKGDKKAEAAVEHYQATK
jgi:hypothetical protein